MSVSVEYPNIKFKLSTGQSSRSDSKLKRSLLRARENGLSDSESGMSSQPRIWGPAFCYAVRLTFILGL